MTLVLVSVYRFFPRHCHHNHPPPFFPFFSPLPWLILQESLAVHAKKVGDVRTWMEDVLVAKRRGVPRILLLTGPPGAYACVCLAPKGHEEGPRGRATRKGHEEGP